MSHRKPNRLSQETSPYLLQHAHNPVDWYSWGSEAFARAQQENKPIFLSVGYSTCYWCHVMERQSFENEEITAEMNRLFVNIKVDREERPDVDQIYMTAVQVMTHQGGWPMSVWLTPDLKPFYAGTYFPPVDSHGRPGFLTVCRSIAEAWKNRRKEVTDAAEEMTGVLRQLAKPQAPTKAFTIDDAWMVRMIDRSISDYDPQNGGFGSAPKFPRETLLRLLLVHQRTFPNPGRMKMIRHSLDAMAAGGIRDHLGGGFHRYSTDAHWLVPHFEIMLYDNAMLAWIYAEAFAQTGSEKYREIARQILDFLLREMRSPEGTFYTAFDAEVDGMEGANYLWTLDEVRDVLGETDAEIFSRAYGLNAGPNFVDPHHGGAQPEKNVLYRAESGDSIAKSLNVETAEIDQRLAAMREKLYQVRLKRKQPSLDTKILMSWNALAIAAFAHASQIFQDDPYLQAAITAANFLLETRGKRKTPFLDDDAFLADALQELFGATRNPHWQNQASTIAIDMLTRFGDSSAGGFFFTSAGADDLIVRQKIGSDSPLPAGAAIAAKVFLALPKSERIARTALLQFAGQLQTHAEAMSAMLELAHLYVRDNPPIEVTSHANTSRETPQILAQDAVDVRAQWAGPDRIIIRVKIQPGFHINSAVSRDGLFPTQLIVTGAETKEIDFPPSRQLQMGDEVMDAYAGDFSVAIQLADVPRQPKEVLLHLQYQPCTDSACLAPVRKAIPLEL